MAASYSGFLDFAAAYAPGVDDAVVSDFRYEVLSEEAKDWLPTVENPTPAQEAMLERAAYAYILYLVTSGPLETVGAQKLERVRDASGFEATMKTVTMSEAFKGVDWLVRARAYLVSLTPVRTGIFAGVAR